MIRGSISIHLVDANTKYTVYYVLYVVEALDSLQNIAA